MAGSRTDVREQNREIYTPDQVESVLQELGIEVKEETGNDFLSYCPFHGNRDTPAFSTSKTFGYSICFNPACAVGSDPRQGPLTLERLIRQLKGYNHFEALRLILSKKNTSIDFATRLDSIGDMDEELKEFPPEAIAKMHARFMSTEAAKAYMKGRGFEKETMEFFRVGFTPATQKPVRKPDMVVVPAYDSAGKPVGLVGRTIVGKEFKNFGPDQNGTGFHKSKIIWNLNNAKRSETVIICESTFDAMRVHQAGYPNVVALLGGSLSVVQEQLLRRHFSRIIIMTDNESADDVIYHRTCRKCLQAGNDMCQGHKPGRDLGMKIAEKLPNVRVSWAAYDDRHVYANDVKDAAGMTDDEIRQCLRNAVSHFEYLDWMVD